MRMLALPILLTAGLLPAAPPDQIRAILANRVTESRRAVGIVVGTIDESGSQVVAEGRLSAGKAGPLDGDTVFEIGSITKVFTSLLLAEMVQKGEVRLEDPVTRYLPENTRIPSRNGKQITLLDLSMQVSGLPRMPNNFKPADPANPYADYGPTQLYEFLSGYTLTRDPGEKYEYSNLAVGLLGHALAVKAGMSYEALVKKRVLEPLGMKDTSIQFSESQRTRLAQGHDPGLKPVKNWDLDALAGAGALRSTANDMLKFLAAAMELKDTPLKPAFRMLLANRRPTGVPALDIAMGWHVLTRFDTEIVWHNGGTAGYRSFAGFIPKAKKGVVVLCNTSLDNDDVGRHLLEPQYEVRKLEAPKVRSEVRVDPKILARYAGEYQFTPAFSIVVSLEGEQLYAQATGQPRFELFAEKDTEFFLKVVEAQITFGVEGDKVTHLILHQNGRDQKAMKVK